MIPKKIHYCWFGGNSFSELENRCLNSWKKFLPDYELKLWNEENSPLNHPYVKRMYKEKKWAFVSDYVRLQALYTEGGIYLDTDMEIIKNIDCFLETESFIGFEDSENVSCGIIGSISKHHFIKDCISEYDTLSLPTNIPKIITKVLRSYGLQDYGKQRINGVSIHETEVFYPWPYKTLFDDSMIVEKSFAIHHWNHSWKLGIRDKIKMKLHKLINKN